MVTPPPVRRSCGLVSIVVRNKDIALGAGCITGNSAVGETLKNIITDVYIPYCSVVSGK